MEKEKPKYSVWQNVRYMLSMAFKNKVPGVIVLCIIASILKILSSLTGILITPVILNCVEERVPLTILVQVILFFTAAMAVWDGLGAYIDRVNRFSGRADIRKSISQQIMMKTCTTSYPNLENQDILKMQRRAQMAVRYGNSAAEAVWDTFSELIKNTGGFFIYLLMLTAVDPVLVAVTTATALAGYALNRYTKSWRYRHRDEISDYELKTWYILRKSGDSRLAKDLRIFGMEGWLNDVYGSVMELYRGYFARREKVCLVADLLSAVLAFLRNGIAYFYLLHMILDRNLPVSEFLLYFAAVGGFTEWIGGILNAFGKLYEQSTEISMAREYLEIPEPFRFEGDGADRERQLCEHCRFELRDVSFRYPGAEKDAISHMNLTIEAGEKLAIVGLNGAGKTTLVRLLCGLYDPTEGTVLLNGRDIKELDRRDYYSLFSAVFQQFSVLDTTIAENVAQSVREIDMEKVSDCIEKAGLSENVEKLLHGLQEHLGRSVYTDGIELSGGEWQRLMLARALYKDAPVIVLDEPTAALDPLAENDIYQKYHAMTGGRTSVYISHRLASTRFCDRIIYLKKGRIAEAGTHEELMKAKGEYAGLFEVQSKYYGEEELYGA